MDYGFLTYFIFVLFGMGFILYADIYTMAYNFERNRKMRPDISLFLSGFVLTIMLTTITDKFIVYYIIEKYNLLIGILFVVLCGFMYDILMVIIYNINLIRYRKRTKFKR